MAQNPIITQLDPGQIVKRVYDEANDRIRVDAEVTATFVGPQEVIISDVDDSIKIGDGTGTFVDVTPANALKVDGSGVVQPVSGTVTANAGTGTFIIGDGGGSITVDGTVSISGPVAVTGPLTDAELRATPVPVSGTVAATQSGTWNIDTVSTITNVVHVDDNGGSLTVDGSVTVSGTVAATQSGTWNINNITGTVSLPTGAATAALQTQPGVDIGDVTVNNGAGAAAVNIQDGGNSITVDGTVAATQSGTWVLGANSGVDIGDVTVNNGAGAGAVNIQDGGNSITVDGTVAATQSGTWVLGANSGVDIGDVTVNNTGGAGAVNIQDGGNSITVDDGGGSITVDGTVTATVSGTVLVSNFPTTVDTNYGTVGANTIRTAAQIGNATGAADFNAGATGAQTLRVTANAGTNLNTSLLATEASLVKLTLTQASTTSGQSGPLVQGAVTTAAPTYVNGQTDPLSLTTAGALRVDGSGTTQPVSGTVAATQSGVWSTRLQDGAGNAITSTVDNSLQSLNVHVTNIITTASNTRPAVTNTASTILAANLNRKYTYIFNQSGSFIFLKLGNTAVVNEGIRLANNDVYEITSDNLWTGTISAIKSGAASVNLEVFEGT